MINIKTSVRVVISILLISIALTDAQISPFARRQQFNLFRQQQRAQAQAQVTEQQDENMIERQSEPQLAQVKIKNLNKF